jgi:mannose-6-phosphate isomerase-like protein (cupin superfamily)
MPLRWSKSKLNGWVALAAFALLSACGAVAQSSVADVYSQSELEAKAQALTKQAAESANGLAGITLEKYPAHFSMFNVRVRTGGAEIHAHFADIFVVIDGEASLVTGGNVVDPKENANGETSGSSVKGGQQRKLVKGDIVHISAGVPHQLLIDPGKTFAYFVFKVQQ